MSSADHEQVAALDHLAFGPLWRISSATLDIAARQAAYASVAEAGSLTAGALAVGANRLRAEVKDLAGNLGEAETTFTATGGSVRVHVSGAGGVGDAVGVPVAIDGVPAGPGCLRMPTGSAQSQGFPTQADTFAVELDVTITRI